MQQCFKNTIRLNLMHQIRFWVKNTKKREKNVRSSIIEAVSMVGFFGYRFLTLGNPS